MSSTVRPRPTHLVCLPYAGGSATTFRGWQEELGGLATVQAISLPGRADRWHLPLPENLHQLADDLAEELVDDPRTPLALFGHSLGGLLAFELTRRLVAAGRAPRLLVVAACEPPSLPRPANGVHTLPDDEFLTWVRAMGATPPDVLDNDELLSILLPVLRADAALGETYRYRPAPPLPVPIATIAGREDDDAAPETMAGWAAETDQPIREFQVDGGHMFVEHNRAAVLDAVRSALAVAGPVAERSR
ncbi:thioesterase II family protein [Actinophytocola xanthii]|uniref:Thioesterase TesA-like domain-containing protein n=1 Tax=Actinophytocola xanthii TaxID=1912961 RepID=A0A1Q8CK14_9PSEU|nr:alpha/beta fold hydrolase [Actinophytocola xanthii]OLF14708.1 hypothetical protein BU204_25805 [Actinophytocola xanthii]